MSEFKELSDDDIVSKLANYGVEDDSQENYTVSGDDGWCILAITFGTTDSQFRKSPTKEKLELSMALKNLDEKTSTSSTQYSWVSLLLLPEDFPTAQSG